jgi:hypothetical protein
MTPFLSIFTPTYRRPIGLAKCMASVQSQTIAERIQHVIVPDYAGVGLVQALFHWPALYAPVLTGEYVTLMADDDDLEGPTVVQSLQVLAGVNGWPDVLIVQATKGGHGSLPLDQHGPPILGRIDLGSVVTRRDVWLEHLKDYTINGGRYESDYDHVRAMWDAGRRFVYTGLPFVRGGVGGGRPE